MWEELSAGIKSFITNHVTGVDATTILEYETNQRDKWPSISITPSDSPAEFADSMRNQRQYTFSIKAYQERTEATAATAEQRMRQLVDELLTAFDSDPELNSLLTGRGYAKAAPSRWFYVQLENNDVRGAEILLVCDVIQ